MIRIKPLAFAMSALAGTASADMTVSVPLELGQMGSARSQSYSCAGGAELAVQYVNAGANAIAILPIDGGNRVFVNVVSGSGAKYVSGAHVWRTKGETATLENELEDAGPQECQTQEVGAGE